jgi:dienelactone hydrolase
VAVLDISIPVPRQDPVNAWLVRPAGPIPARALAGVIYLHWFEPSAADQNRSEFLAEAAAIAELGAVAILPDLTFPWSGSIHGDLRDVDAVRAQAYAIRAVYRALLAEPGVDPYRTAVVGHDYGAMYGALLATSEPTIRAQVAMCADATWSHWFCTYFLDLPDRDLPAYRALFASLDPVDHVARRRAHLYVQWGGRDKFIGADVREAFAAADPDAHTGFYENSDHFLDDRAKDDRIAWLQTELELARRRHEHPGRPVTPGRPGT